MPEILKIVFLLKIQNLVNGSVFVWLHGSQDIQYGHGARLLSEIECPSMLGLPRNILDDIKHYGSSNFRLQVIEAGPNRKSLTRARDRAIQELKASGITVLNKPRKIPTHMSRKPGYVPNQMWTNNPMRFPKIRAKVAAKMKERVYVRNEKGQIIKHYSREQWDALQTSNIPGV